MGQPILIEDIGEQLSSLLEPLLTKQFTIVNNRKIVKLGDSDLEFDENFRMYFTTKLQNPHYLPEIFIRVTVINFTVTSEGLQEQLLGEVVKKEMPEVEMVRKDLVVQIAQGKVQLKKGEDKILDLLSNSKGMILDDIDLIESLKLSKEMAMSVSEKLAIAESKQEEISVAMNKYAPVARRGTVMYFVIADLALIDSMYQFSLNYFGNLYSSIIDTTKEQKDRINLLISNITSTVFENICRGLFNNHKRIFSFLVAAKILIQELKTVTLGEWNSLIKGIFVLNPLDVAKPEKAPFTDSQWQ
jgi:dynein heavy chain